jgi:hypothetical protein
VDPATQQTCAVDGTWGSDTTCSPGACITNACSVCTPGATRCKGKKKLETCDLSGKWGVGVDCLMDCIDPPGACELADAGAD